MTSSSLDAGPQIKALAFATKRVEGESAVVEISADVAQPAGCAPMAVEFSLAAADNTFKAVATVADGEASAHMEIERVSLWWPRELGSPELHQLAARLFAAGKLLGASRQTVGIRAIEIVRPPDPDGFHAPIININGREMACRWADWNPPLDTIEHATFEEYAERIAAIDANTLRVSGGGICESDAFYTACDRIGMLVWLDFVIRGVTDGRTIEECRRNASRSPTLRNHPCIALVW